MSEPKIILPVAPPAVDKVELLKSHVAAYTRKDGSVVAAHDDKRTAAHAWASPKSHAARHAAFADGLADLSAKHGVVVRSTGGVNYHSHPDEVKHLSYENDHSSGDLRNNVDDNGVADPKHTSRYAVEKGSDESARFTKFTSDLSDLSKKHGVSMSGSGNVTIHDKPSEADGVHYTKDHTSGDIWPVTDDDGNYVKKKKAPAAPAAKEKAKPANYDHPNVVGKAEKLQGGDASKAHGMSFAGKEFSASGKEGTSFHDGTPVRHFTERSDDDGDSGEHVWMDHKGRVHADGTSDVPRLRKMHEAHVAKSAPKAKKAVAKPKPSAPADDAPAEGEVGHHEHKTYGVYHKPGSKVKDNYGKTHEVHEHSGPVVAMKDGSWFHPTKVHKQD